MLEITGDDICKLSDEDLRSLVGLLCEGELRRLNLPVSAVTWGGDQNARDGGIDVRVVLPADAVVLGFLPRPVIGFQVKKPDMTPGLIGPEMRPEGVLRPLIRELADSGGAYIIVSSGTDASDSALNNRRTAMREALSDAGNAADLLTDFYDQSRLATWARNYPGLALWIRTRTGRAIAGWRSYDAWAFSPDGTRDIYLLEDKARLHAGTHEAAGMPVLEGLARIREKLQQPRGVVRLAGLSGVGKTRLVQALFDRRVGDNSLDPAMAIYADMADNPDPQPIGMASDLIAGRARAVLVVDNCQPALHSRLSELCRAAESTVSLLTVEYDIRDDEPEGTDVFRLEPSSPDLVASLIKRRFQEISDVDANTIGQFSGGNARIAIALANTLERYESIAGLQEEELFRRLFHQRQAPDESLLKAAQACALVYSFEGEALTGPESELPAIAPLAGTDAVALFGKVAELRRRDLVQRRSVWRAVLPHAIANRLAAMALQNIPLAVIEAQLSTARLMRSFSRRLGYLHESEEALRVVEDWLEPRGKLGDFVRLNELGLAMFYNVAPVSPASTLAALERALGGPDAAAIISNSSRRNGVASLLRSLAYEAALFDRCVAGLVSLLEAETKEERNHNQHVKNVLSSLFHLFLSGTHAPVETRVRIAEPLLRSEDSGKRAIGLLALERLLHAGRFMSAQGFEFGARPRDYGYVPKLRSDVRAWYAAALGLAASLACSDLPVAPEVRKAIATNFRDLWYEGIWTELEQTTQKILARDHWEAGWIAVRTTLRFDGKNSPESTERLRQLEKLLRPKGIEHQVRAVVLSGTHEPLDFDDPGKDEDDDASPISGYQRAEAVAKELGGRVAADTTGLLATLAPELVTHIGSRPVSFGMGLGAEAQDRQQAWNTLVIALDVAPERQQAASVFCGFLSGAREKDPQFCEVVLDAALAGGPLTAWFPTLQSCAPVHARAIARLKQSIASGKASLGHYKFLGWDRDPDELPGPALKDLVLAIASQPHGYVAAADIVSMRCHGNPNKEKERPPELYELGRELMARVEFEDRDHMHDYRLGTIVTVCLKGKEGEQAARALCTAFKQAASTYAVHAFQYEHLTKALFATQPTIALDVFFGGDRPEQKIGVRTFAGMDEDRTPPVDAVSDDDVLRWCQGSPDTRYPVMAEVITYSRGPKDAPLQWTPLALRLIENAPDPLAILNIFIERFSPRSWSGSRAAIIESRARLLEDLRDHPNPAIVEMTALKRFELEKKIAQEREWETKRDRDRDERFE